MERNNTLMLSGGCACEQHVSSEQACEVLLADLRVIVTRLQIPEFISFSLLFKFWRTVGFLSQFNLKETEKQKQRKILVVIVKWRRQANRLLRRQPTQRKNKKEKQQKLTIHNPPKWPLAMFH